MKVLMSIKPEFAFKIFEQKKKFEFRRAIFKNPDIKTIIVYASYPVQKVIGEFEIADILVMDIEELWQQTANEAGITKACFNQYFVGKEQGYAIKIKKAKKYNTPLCIKDDFNVQQAPQSFRYVA